MNLISVDFDIVMVNRTNERLYAKSMTALLGNKCYSEFEKRDKPCPHCPGRLALETGEAQEAETTGMRDDGTRFSARIKAHPVIGPDNRATGFIEIVEDITEQKRAESLALSTRSCRRGSPASRTCAAPCGRLCGPACWWKASIAGRRSWRTARACPNWWSKRVSTRSSLGAFAARRTARDGVPAASRERRGAPRGSPARGHRRAGAQSGGAAGRARRGVHHLPGDTRVTPERPAGARYHHRHGHLPHPGRAVPRRRHRRSGSAHQRVAPGHLGGRRARPHDHVEQGGREGVRLAGGRGGGQPTTVGRAPAMAGPARWC